MHRDYNELPINKLISLYRMEEFTLEEIEAKLDEEKFERLYMELRRRSLIPYDGISTLELTLSENNSTERSTSQMMYLIDSLKKYIDNK